MRPQLFAAALGVVALSACLAVSHATSQPQVLQMEVTTPAGNRGVMMRPSGDGVHPGVLHLHGNGDTVANNLSILRLFARAGYVAIGVDYREPGGGTVDLEDMAAALDVLRHSPHVQPDALVLNGFSRGGRTALRLAAIRSDVRAVSAIAARTTGGTPPTIVDEAARLRMPILLQHGAEDPIVPYADSVALASQLKALGRPVEFFTYPLAEHNNLPWDRVYQRVLLFFQDQLR